MESSRNTGKIIHTKQCQKFVKLINLENVTFVDFTQQKAHRAPVSLPYMDNMCEHLFM